MLPTREENDGVRRPGPAHPTSVLELIKNKVNKSSMSLARIIVPCWREEKFGETKEEKKRGGVGVEKRAMRKPHSTTHTRTHSQPSTTDTASMASRFKRVEGEFEGSIDLVGLVWFGLPAMAFPRPQVTAPQSRCFPYSDLYLHVKA